MKPKDFKVVPVILHPGIYPLVFFEDSVRQLLLLWRNGYIRPQMARPLIQNALSYLSKIGIEDATLKCWALWFCDPRCCDIHHVTGTTVSEAFRELRARLPEVHCIEPNDKFIQDFVGSLSRLASV